MVKKVHSYSMIISAAAILLLIFDPQTGLSGALEALELCFRTVIPSLFPFFVVSAMVTSGISGKTLPMLKPLRRLCGIPEGAEGLFLLGLVGGYPVGAQAIAQSWEAGLLSKKQARRMLGFCSNCGPSFLFGIAASLFSDKTVPWVLWLIHILSAVLTGILLPDRTKERLDPPKGSRMDISAAIEKALRTMETVCAWILLSRCFLAYLDKWFLRRVPEVLRILFAGVIELTNGCVSLSSIPSEPERFRILSGFLALGGLCITMQTVSVTGRLGTGWYFPGKLMQLAFSISLSSFFLPLLFPGSASHWELLPFPFLGILILKRKQKKEVAFSGELVYNML